MKAASFAPVLWLMLVLVLIPLVLLVLKRSGLAARLGTRLGAPAAGRLVLRDSLVIGPNQRVVALEVGSGAQRQWLLLGVTPQQITTLHTLDAPDDAPATPERRTGSPSFAATTLPPEIAPETQRARTLPGGGLARFDAVLARVRSAAMPVPMPPTGVGAVPRRAAPQRTSRAAMPSGGEPGALS